MCHCNEEMMKPHRNRGLFSNYYLDELLPKEEAFKIPISEVEQVFNKVKEIWDKSRFETINEDQLRKHFLDKVLDYLGWTVDVNAPVPSGEWSKRPDYALFKDNESLKVTHKGKKEDYFKKAACIAEAKRWGRPLDKKLKTEVDPFEAQNPSLQISRYLWLTGVKWGILTDGKYWRLYERETSKRLDIFYEIDLEDLIESSSPDDFRYFYLLFRKDAFPEFIEKVYKESVDYAEAVGEKLKENVYQALKTLAQGFLKTPGNNLSEANLKEIHDNSLIFLYRLLFILYAEYRDLLPLGSNKLYTESYSLDAFKKEVANRLDRNEPIATSTFGYWNRLKELFDIIDRGNKELDVPPYNGGLFEPEKHDFLEKHRVGDLYIAKAVDLLSRSKDKAYIDYGSLEIRHLGSIYEGILEYKLKIADQDLVPIKDKGKEVFVLVEEAKTQKRKIREEEIVRTGEVYLVTDKGERKATGSYYTPDYIVKYIVENTLSPIIEEKKKTALQIADNKVKDINNIKNEIKNLKIQKSKAMNPVMVTTIEQKVKEKENQLNQFEQESKPTNIFLEEILNIKVLDPAMGSGHFLVEATDFLARELLKVLSGEPLEGGSKEMMIGEEIASYGLKDPEEEDIRWARREVVERCIFGVDLNPMAVELAKLSLWLYTVARNRPLNFLDHHFRCGNSLIGARIEDLAGLPELKKKKTVEGQLGLFESIFKEKVNILLGAFAQIEGLPSDTVEQIREKERLYQDFRNIVSHFQDVADIWTNNYFGNEIDFGHYQKLQDKLRSTDEEWKILSPEPWFKKAKETANEKRFFHWELEFPEIFFEGHLRKENPGFDAVIGNPPYRDLKELDPQIVTLLFLFFKATHNRANLYASFVEKALNLVRKDGQVSMIVPNSWATQSSYIKLKERILNETHLHHLVRIPETAFPEQKVETIIFCSKTSKPLNDAETIFIGYRDDIKVREIDYKSAQFAGKKFQSEVFGNIGTLWEQISGGDDLLSKLDNCSAPLVTVCDVSLGLTPYDKYKGHTEVQIKSQTYHAKYKKDETYKPLLSGGDISRYSVQWNGIEWISYGDWLGAPREKIFFTSPRILVKQIIDWTSRRIHAGYTSDELYNGQIAFNLIPLGPESHLYILSLLNSSLMNYYHKRRFLDAVKVRFQKILIQDAKKFPIRRINYIKSVHIRKSKVREAEKLYVNALTKQSPGDFLVLIEELLFTKNNPEFDTVHDLLVYLAEQMIEMNKERQNEIKGFIGWLESQLKVQPDKDGNKGIEVLSGKSQIKNYLGDYQKGEEHLPFDDFWKILEKNKTRVQANLKSRELYETIKSEYEKSLSKLLPMKEKLQKTDWLIDQIVYKLYGLTEEEIKIVEGERQSLLMVIGKATICHSCPHFHEGKLQRESRK